METSMYYYSTCCTGTQTQRAFKLGAPLDKFDPDNSNGIIIEGKCFSIPTIQQMLGWLKDKGFDFKINTQESTYAIIGYATFKSIGDMIDASLHYLETEAIK